MNPVTLLCLSLETERGEKPGRLRSRRKQVSLCEETKELGWIRIPFGTPYSFSEYLVGCGSILLGDQTKILS